MKNWLVIRQARKITVLSEHFLKVLADKARAKAEKEEGVPFNPVLKQTKFVVMHRTEWERKQKEAKKGNVSFPWR
jgi:hypothetical protein